jgi:phage tail-like protein
VATNDLEKFISIFGYVADSVKTEIDMVRDNYDIEVVHAKLIPYIDAILGWPTNVDLDVQSRRRETSRAVDLYKIKGRIDALEAFVENVASWEATTHYGWLMVMYLNNEETPLPTPATVDLTKIWALDDELKYLPSQESWRCLNGVNLRFEEIEDVSSELAATTLRKLSRIAPKYVASHWTNLSYTVDTLDNELVPAPVDLLSREDIIYGEVVPVPVDVEALAVWGSMVSLVVLNVSSRTMNTATVRMHHKDLSYSGTTPPPAYSVTP